MNRMLMSALLGAAAFAPGAALAQSPECDRLVLFLEQNAGAQLPVDIDVERVRTLQTERNEAECTALLQQVEQQGGQPAAQQGADSVDANATPETQEGQQQGEGANITVQQAAPSITVEQPSPQISVQQSPPNVTVSQPQPEIIVRQPAPVVTIDIPQPEIIVRMPQPQVTVEQAQPQIQVEQAQPEVSVVQPEQPQVQVQEAQPAQVQLTQPETQANVQVQQTGEAQVTYERAEPQVTINQAEGQPTVTIEQMEGDAAAQGADSVDANTTPGTQEGQATADQAAQDQQQQAAATQEGQQQQAAATQEGQQQPAADQAAQGQQQAAATQSGQQAAGGDMQRVPVGDLAGMTVVNEAGEEIGEVEGVVQSAADQRMYVVIENGGFLGIGENRIALSLDGLMVRGDNVVVPGLTTEQIRALPKFEASDQYPEVRDMDIEIRTLAQQ